MYSLIRQFLFRLDAETAHEIAVRLIRASQKNRVLLSGIAKILGSDTVARPRTIWGLQFRNPLGIAAGFDKNGQMIPFLAALGFGFVEVGTVTLHPQPGNPKPRMFRLPEDGALINRLGFNNQGAAAVAARLAKISRDPATVPLFVNIGKNKDVPTDEAAQAYEDCYRILAPHADAVVVNISSPNTPGLRDLQTVDHISEIVERLKRARTELSFARAGEHPILVKIAPDLDDGQLTDLAAVCSEIADGMIATNTTIAREGLSVYPQESGGLSGRPLFAKSTEVLRKLRKLTGPDYPLIGVGGVMNGEDAIEKLNAGADLVQAYSGFVYGGPGFAKSVRQELAQVR